MDINKIEVKIEKSNKWVRFKTNVELTENEAMFVQAEKGYHPAGYGFYAYEIKDGSTYWACSNTCD